MDISLFCRSYLSFRLDDISQSCQSDKCSERRKEKRPSVVLQCRELREIGGCPRTCIVALAVNFGFNSCWPGETRRMWSKFRPFKPNKKSGAAALIRQSGSILDIATAICSRSNCAFGFVNQHRVLSLMEGRCRAAKSCKAGVVVVGALRIACSGLCTAARFHTAEEIPG